MILGGFRFAACFLSLLFVLRTLKTVLVFAIKKVRSKTRRASFSAEVGKRDGPRDLANLSRFDFGSLDLSAICSRLPSVCFRVQAHQSGSSFSNSSHPLAKKPSSSISATVTRLRIISSENSGSGISEKKACFKKEVKG